jgi:O-antigen/teichoic acid export membrane protein
MSGVARERSFSLSAHLFDGTVWVLLAEALFPLTGLLTAAFLTRQLGPSDYGVLTLTATLVSWIEGTISAVLSRATVKLVSEASDWRPIGATVLRLYLVVSCGVALALWFCAPLLATLFADPQMAWYVQLFALDIPLFSLAQAHRSILIGLGRFRHRAATGAVRWLTRLVLMVGLVALGFSIPGAIFGSVGASLVELIVGRYYIRPALRSSFSVPFRHVWQYAAPLFFSTCCLGLYVQLDLLALKALGGTPTQVGMLSAARNLALVGGFLAASIAPLLQATLSALLQNGNRGQARALGRSVLRIALGLFPFIAVGGGADREIIVWLFGAQFSSAAPLFTVLIIGAWAQAIVSVSMAIFMADGQLRVIAMLTAPFAPLALAGHCLFVPQFGALGAALVSTGVAVLGLLATLIILHRLWNILPPVGTVWRSIVVSLGIYVLAMVWPTPGLLLLVKLPILALAILFAFHLLGEFTTGEVAFARALIKRQTPTTPG